MSSSWAFGIVLWEIMQLGEFNYSNVCIILANYFTGSNPYPGIENRKILGLLKRGYRMPQPPECPDDMLV